LDEAVTRLTAGLTVADLRALLRGESLRRPDPRLAVHTRSFWLHIKPRYYHEAATRFTHTFRLGLLATVLLVIEALTGVLLMFYYTPSPDRAYGDMVRIISAVPFGQLTRDLHRLAAEGLVVVALLHLARAFLTGSYKDPRRFTWATGVVLLALVLFLSFSGYLLPWDQLAYWAVTIGTSLADKIPPAALGAWLKSVFLGGPEVGADALLRFYLLHVLLVPLVAGVFFAVHYFKVVRAGISLPSAEEEVGRDTARRVPVDRRRYTIPDVLSDEIVFVSLVSVALLGAIAFGLYRGAPLEAHADPLRTPVGIAAPWYFLWVQGLLKLGNATLLGVVLPVAAFLILLLIPYLDRNPSRRARDRKVAIALFAATVFALAGLTWLGRPAFGVELPPAQAVAERMMPEEGQGAITSLAFEELKPGDWDSRVYELSSAGPALRGALASLEAALTEQPALAGARARLVISQPQPGLKKLSLRLFWQQQDGTEQVYERHAFVHAGAPQAGAE
jgi:quinol-cytochrome oxidoreductase complex cytochrome b subunit